jgi:hypothetical protein
VIGAGVPVADAQGGQLQLDRATAAAGCGGEDRAVVGQHRGGHPMRGGGGVEAGHDIGCFGGGAGVAGDQEPGVVIEHVEDLDLDAAGKVPVGDIGSLGRAVRPAGAPVGPGALGWYDRRNAIPGRLMHCFRRSTVDGGLPGELFLHGGLSVFKLLKDALASSRLVGLSRSRTLSLYVLPF